jgi:hypothetical protein
METMHPKREELLDVRDGTPSPEVARHVGDCPACRAEVDRLRQVREALRALPELAAPSDGWDRVRAAHRRAVVQRRWRQSGAVALAASVVMAVGLIVLQPTHVAVTPVQSELSLLYSQSAGLEAVLARLDADDRVLDLRAAGAIVAIEDRIAALDDHLTNGETLDRQTAEALWRQRVELMEALVGVHAAHAQPAVFAGVY